MDMIYSNIEIDFTLLNGIVLIPSTVDTEHGYLIFDTGAMKTALHKKYFSNVQGKELEVAKFNGDIKSEQTDTASEVTIHSLSFSDVALTDRSAMLMDLSYVEDSLSAFDPDVRILGTMGIDIISGFSVIMDYEKGRIVLNPSCRFAKYTCVPMKTEPQPIIDIEISGEKYSFVLDTGANTCLLGAALQNRLTVQPVKDDPGIFMIPSLSLQGHSYSDVVSVFADISAIQSQISVDGIIGYQILLSQRTYFDFSNQRLYLEQA